MHGMHRIGDPLDILHISIVSIPCLMQPFEFIAPSGSWFLLPNHYPIGLVTGVGLQGVETNLDPGWCSCCCSVFGAIRNFVRGFLVMLLSGQDPLGISAFSPCKNSGKSVADRANAFLVLHVKMRARSLSRWLHFVLKDPWEKSPA